jgi:hypothetical protein
LDLLSTERIEVRPNIPDDALERAAHHPLFAVGNVTDADPSYWQTHPDESVRH